MNPKLRLRFVRYGLALLAVLVALGVRLALDPVLGQFSPYATFYIAILFAARFCGTAPATLVVVLGALASAYYIIPPRGSLRLESVEFATGMVLYWFVGLTIIILYRLLHIAQIRLLAEHRQLMLDEELTRHTLELLERERKLLAYEIHDGLIQYATAAAMYAEAARSQKQLSGDDPNLALAHELMRRMVQEGRRLINGLRPVVLDQFGLVAAVKALCAEQPAAKPEIEFVVEGAWERMPPTLETALFRIVQEALTNARKHSQSDKVRVVLQREANRIELEIKDWGVGFEPAPRSNRIHGLNGIQERVRLLGGQFRLETGPNQGTRLTVEFPWSAAEDDKADVAAS